MSVLPVEEVIGACCIDCLATILAHHKIMGIVPDNRRIPMIIILELHNFMLRRELGCSTSWEVLQKLSKHAYALPTSATGSRANRPNAKTLGWFQRFGNITYHILDAAGV